MSILSGDNPFYIKEVKWVSPKHDEEHDEVHTQAAAKSGTYPDHVHKMLNHLKDKNNYQTAMKNGKSMTVTPVSVKKISNTDASSKPRPGVIDKEKSNRVKKQMSGSKPVTKPTVLHDTHTGHTHLLAGNTRLTHNIHHGSGNTPVHAITYDSSRLEK